MKPKKKNPKRKHRLKNKHKNKVKQSGSYEKIN